MSENRLKFIRLGLRTRGVSTILRLRWDRSPGLCAVCAPLLPIESQVYHAKYANNEIYILTPMPEKSHPPEWACLYPGPGDLMYAPVGSNHSGNLVSNALSGSVPEMDLEKGILDWAFFYERGNSLIGPAGISQASIIATGTSFEELDKLAEACRDIWFSGAKNEIMYIEPA